MAYKDVQIVTTLTCNSAEFLPPPAMLQPNGQLTYPLLVPQYSPPQQLNSRFQGINICTSNSHISTWANGKALLVHVHSILKPVFSTTIKSRENPYQVYYMQVMHSILGAVSHMRYTWMCNETEGLYNSYITIVPYYIRNVWYRYMFVTSARTRVILILYTHIC